MQHFPAAPWSTLLKITSAVSTLILLGVSYAAGRAAPPADLAHDVGMLVAWLPLTVPLGALLFVVRGYEIDGNELRVRRLLWTTRVPLKGVKNAWQDPDVIKGSLRVFGNGGVFSFTGLFWSKRFGRYRLYATDLKRAVVLVLTDRIVVVTPADPEAFLQQVRTLFSNVQGRDR
jgi:PH (Pleckstrin Homology) domain-containing protein